MVSFCSWKLVKSFEAHVVYIIKKYTKEYVFEVHFIDFNFTEFYCWRI